MKTTFRDLFIANGFVENGLLFERKLKSPVNPDATAKITISIFHNEFSAVVENYFGTKFNNYSGSDYYNFKSAKCLMNRLSKDCSFYGF